MHDQDHVPAAQRALNLLNNPMPIVEVDRSRPERIAVTLVGPDGSSMDLGRMDVMRPDRLKQVIDNPSGHGSVPPG